MRIPMNSHTSKLIPGHCTYLTVKHRDKSESLVALAVCNTWVCWYDLTVTPQSPPPPAVVINLKYSAAESPMLTLWTDSISISHFSHKCRSNHLDVPKYCSRSPFHV